MTVRTVLQRLLALVRADRLDRELDDEIAAHIELAERDARAAGLTPAEARRLASRQFGQIEPMKEAHRDQRSARWIDYLVKDFRHGLASLAREPGFAAVAVGVLALGIGANAAMFSLVDAVLLKPMPFSEPERVVRVWQAPRPGVINSSSTLDFLDWKRLGTSFEALAAENPLSVALTGNGDPVRLSGKRVTSDYFKVFATTAHVGRTFTPDDDRPGASPVVVISHATWQTQFGGDTDILRRALILDGIAHDVVGVLPPGVFDRDAAEFWKPLVFTPDQMRRDWHWLSVVGRLDDGMTLSRAREELSAINAVVADVTPIWKRDWTMAVERFDQLLVGETLRRSLLVAFGAVIMVLLIACANVTNLLLAKGVARQKEMAVRSALGASRARLVAQLLTEGLALCLLGGLAGVAIASALIAVVTPLLSEAVPSGIEVALDLRVLTFTAVAALGVTMLVGLLPSLQLPVGHLSQALSRSSRGTTGARRHIRRAIVVAEVALSLVLVCGAVLLFKSLANLRQIDTGVRIDNVITMSVDLPDLAYATPERMASFYGQVTEQIEGAPGVARAAVSTYLPLRWIGNGEALFVPGLDEPVSVRLKRVDAGYFEALDIPVVAGRGITSRDRAGAPSVVVVNEALARALRDRQVATPVGQAAQLTTVDGRLDVQIAGVIRSERVADPGRPDPPVVYVPLAQAPVSGVKLIVRTHLEPAAVMSGIHAAVRRVDANLPLGEIATMQQVRERTLSFASRPAWIIGTFAAVALLLAALGLYGVIAHAVTERTREIGIRMALGARSRDVVAQVLRNAMSLVAGGLAIGLVGTVAITRVIESLLFEVAPLDPLALAVACGSMIFVGLLAGFLPASRAARVEPVTVLRNDG